MSAVDVLAALQQRGATVRLKPQADGEPILNVAPSSALDAVILAEIRAHKTELLQLVSASEKRSGSRPAVAVGRGPDDVIGLRIEARFNRDFTPAEIEEYNRVVNALERGQEPQDNHQ